MLLTRLGLPFLILSPLRINNLFGKTAEGTLPAVMGYLVGRGNTSTTRFQTTYTQFGKGR